MRREHRAAIRSEGASWHGLSGARHAERPLSDARRRQYRPYVF